MQESNVPTALTRGDYRALEYIAHYHPELLLKKDPNGWQPVHEVRFFLFNFVAAMAFFISNVPQIEPRLDDSGANSLDELGPAGGVGG